MRNQNQQPFPGIFTSLFVLLFLVSGFQAAAQDTVVAVIDSVKIDTLKPGIWQNFKYDGRNVWGGIKHTYTQPFHWKEKDLLTAGGVVAGTALLFLADDETSEYFVNQGKNAPHAIKQFGWYFGSPQNNYGITGGVYLFGLLTNNEKIRKTGVLMIASATASGVIQTFAKTIAGRGRPIVGNGPASFKPFSGIPDYNSFPSGHTVLSFTTAYAIGKQFKNPWVKSGIYAVGMIAPVSRLWAGAHWLTDVALSTALSVAVVDGIDNFLNKEQKYNTDPTNKKISWSFQCTGSTIGIVGTF